MQRSETKKQSQNDRLPILRSDSSILFDKSNKLLDSSISSTGRSIKMLEDSKATGGKTLQLLGEQGEQIRRIQGGVDNIIEEEVIAERHASSIRSVVSYFFNKIKPWPSKKDNVSKADKVVAADKKKEDRKRLKEKKHEKPIENQYFFSLDNPILDAKNQKVDHNIDIMDDLVGDLKEIATSMGDELREQNTRLGILNKTTREASDNMNSLNRMI